MFHRSGPVLSQSFDFVRFTKLNKRIQIEQNSSDHGRLDFA